MKKVRFTEQKDGFCGLFSKRSEDAAVIIMNDDGPEDFLAKAGIRWVNRMGLSAMAVGPSAQMNGLHSWPLERAENAVLRLKNDGFSKIGICGVSSGANMALCAAAMIPDITLTIALTPMDWVHWGYFHDNLDGMKERPAEGESAYTWRGEPVKHVAAPLKHPDYYGSAIREAKRRGDMVAARELYDLAEERNPLTGEVMIPVERIRGRLLLAGAEDDVLWNTCRAIRRMEKRIQDSGRNCECEALIYEHCSHFIFPETMIRLLLPRFAVDILIPRIFRETKGFVKECRNSRTDLDKHIRAMIFAWKGE